MKNELQRCNLLWHILDKVTSLLDKCCYKKGVRFDFRVGLAQRKPNQSTIQPHHMLELSITNREQIPVTIVPRDLEGNPAPVEAGSVVWEKLDGDANVVPSEDGMTGMLVSQDFPETGDSTFKVSADADIGQGIETITDTVLLHVGSPHAVNLGLQAGPVEPKPQAKPEKK